MSQNKITEQQYKTSQLLIEMIVAVKFLKTEEIGVIWKEIQELEIKSIADLVATSVGMNCAYLSEDLSACNMSESQLRNELFKRLNLIKNGRSELGTDTECEDIRKILWKKFGESDNG